VSKITTSEIENDHFDLDHFDQVHSGTDPIVHFFAHFFVWYIIILYLCLQKLESVCLENKERRAERGFTT
jgi:hypothetical protein